jgi:spore maturation protein CgeB
MHFVVFGLGMSSSWGNGHATLWRGLVKALARRGHTLTFYEKDVPYYASSRDGWKPPDRVRLRLYREFAEIRSEVGHELAHTDIGLTTSYCADGKAAAHALLSSPAEIKAFYDLDTPVTLSAVQACAQTKYLPSAGLANFDLVLSYTGGRALAELKTRLGARIVSPLYGWVDSETHYPAAGIEEFRSELCYLGTFAEDRQEALDRLFLETAGRQPEKRFAMAGAQYPDDFPWRSNIYFVRHLPPALHPTFLCSSRATLNVTRGVMASYGFCPSGRLFEAAACGVAILSDWWEGLDTFFSPGDEILQVTETSDVIQALSLSDDELKRIATAARERTLQCHTAEQRVLELETICESVHQRAREPVSSS